MSDSIKSKVDTLNLARRETEKRLEWYRGQKDGLAYCKNSLEAQLEEVRQRIKALDETIQEHKDAMLIATAQIDFVKECAAIRKEELENEEPNPEATP